MTLVLKSSRFDVSAETLFAFHLDAENLARISPPWPPIAMVSSPKPTAVGDVQVFRVGPWPVSQTWQARITRLVPGRLLEDTQESGPFVRWRHQHRVAREGPGSRLTDVVSFRLLPTPAGAFIEYYLVRPAFIAMFAWRHRRTRRLLAPREA
jgi:ligand-binding SRPBCC domain-containing protein